MTASPARLTQDDYFAFALKVLAEGSHEDLTIQAMCDGLQITKGSFYHHFGSFPGFVEAFLHHWERETAVNVENLARRIESVTMRQRFMEALIETIPHDAEAAIRVWARTDPTVRAVQERVDKSRTTMLADFFVLHMPMAQARLIGELYNAVLVAGQMSSKPVAVKSLRQQMTALSKLVVGRYGHIFRDDVPAKR
ncbi:TetR family transcriptional regulator [Mycobacterium antarcticum]|uniref:TetR/AcrR family transcriptional regulator n=1 Tax=unclassified Mycolicibacterium TaxID=2636767 RepID=UPI00238FB3C1|nr:MULTISPECIES: TetR/AcrR family transcriptional regulator [unclassified Mycolicibacterium]BDX33663.1 TetR family transcriptional regulator [Mycolicibacterium sp. TUM20985]GLP76830.1 TetR family transcriptional regulator [Mycolicibacterium sp. TUM20983]